MLVILLLLVVVVVELAVLRLMRWRRRRRMHHWYLLDESPTRVRRHPHVGRHAHTRRLLMPLLFVLL